MHWPTAITLHAVASAALAIAAYDVTHHDTLPRLQASATDLILIGALCVVATLVGWFWLRGRKELVRKIAAVAAATWHLVVGWCGLGLATYAATALTDPGWHGSLFLSAVNGPLAWHSVPHAHIVLPLVTVWTIAVFWYIDEKKIAHRNDEHPWRSLTTRARKLIKLPVVSHSQVASPEGASFVETTQQVRRYVIPSEQRANRAVLGIAQLAPARGKVRRPVALGLPHEGSGLLFGGPGSGKSIIYQTILLDAAAAGLDNLPIKIIALSTKPRDLAGPTSKWLRSQGFPVSMWDLTGSTTASDLYGDPVRWSPLIPSTTYDGAKRTARRLIEAAHETRPASQERFWLGQAAAVIAPCLLAAAKRGASYQEALRWAQGWSDPTMTDVDRILSASGEQDALGVWQTTRELILRKVDDFTWAYPQGQGLGSSIGLSINATLTDIMSQLSTQCAHNATQDPNLDPKEWVRAEGGAVLFLTGNTQEEGATRSLLAPVLHDLLEEAVLYASNEANGGRLPYRLLVLGDELANLAPIRNISQMYATARSYRIQLLCAFQSFAQLENHYGGPVARSLLDSSTAILVLSGIKDPELLRALIAIGGTEQTEVTSYNQATGDESHRSETKSMQSRALLDGHVLGLLRSPDPELGSSGDGLLILSGGIARVTIPLWSLSKIYAKRGQVPPQHLTGVEALRRRGARSFVRRVRRQ